MSVRPVSLMPGATPLASWRSIFFDAGAAPRSRLPAAVIAESPDRGGDRPQGRAGLRRSTPASASSPAFASMPPIWRRCSAISSCRTAPASGEPLPAADRPADDGAEARQPGPGSFGRPPGDRRAAWPMLDATSSRDPRPGLGRRLGRSRAPGAHGGRHDRSRRDHASTAVACRPRRPWPRPASRRWCSDPRKALRCSTAPSSPPRYALAGLFEAEECCTPRWSPARSRPMPPRARTRRSTRASTRYGVIAGRSRLPAA